MSSMNKQDLIELINECIDERIAGLVSTVNELPTMEDVLVGVASRLTRGMRVTTLAPEGATKRKMDELDIDDDKTSGKKRRVWSDEERKAAGVRLQTARAANLGLTLDQLRFLKLRPGAKPTAAQIKAAQKAHPGRPGETAEKPKKAKKAGKKAS